MNLLRGSVVIYHLTSSTLLMARFIYASFVSLLFILFKFNLTRQLCGFGARSPFKWIQPLNFSLLVSLQVLLLPLCPLPQSYFRMLFLFPLHWKTSVLVQLSFLPPLSRKVIILLKQTVPVEDINSQNCERYTRWYQGRTEQNAHKHTHTLWICNLNKWKGRLFLQWTTTHQS